MESIVMRRTSAELKRRARENLKGKWGLMMGANVLMVIIIYAAEFPFYIMSVFNQNIGTMITYMAATLLISLASVVLTAGVIKMNLNLARKQEISLGIMFSQFVNRPDRYILGGLLLLAIAMVCLLPGYICIFVGAFTKQIFIIVLSFLLLIAGLVGYIILVLQYSLVNMLFLDNPQMRVIAAFKESARVMRGNKGRMFYISLSFLGWTFLAMLSCGIGMLWVTPYMSQTSVMFYLDVKGELDAGQIIE